MSKTPETFREEGTPSMNPTIDEYFALSTGDIPLKKQITPIRRKPIRDILLGSSQSVTLLTGPRASGRSTVAAVTSILHALHGDGNALCVAAEYSTLNYTVLSTMRFWIGAIMPNPDTWKIGFGNVPEFRFKLNDTRVYMVSWENIRHMHYDFLTHFIRCKGVNLVWIEDLERFDDVIDFAHYVRAHPQRTHSKFIINYQLESLNDATHRAVSLLRPIVTSKYSLPMAKSFIRRHCYKELVAEEQRRQERFKCEHIEKQLKGTST